MFTLTTPIAIPNVTKIKAASVLLFDESSLARITVLVLSPGATPRTKRMELTVGNAGAELAGPQSTTVTKNLAPVAFDDDVVYGAPLSIADGYDQIEAAYRGGVNKAAAFRAVEQKLADLHIIDATLAGTVG